MRIPALLSLAAASAIGAARPALVHPQSPPPAGRAPDVRLQADEPDAALSVARRQEMTARLAALGVYGVVSYVVTQSRRELGLRMALGAAPRDVLGLVLYRGLALTGVGIIVGLAVALGTTRLLGDLLYKVSPRDPRIFALAVAVMVVGAVAACAVPASRAARTDVVKALRV